MTDLSPHPLAVVNLVVCGAILVVCICRLSACHAGVAPLVRLKYTSLLSGALAYGFQPLLFATWPTPGGVFFAATVLLWLFCSRRRWRVGPRKKQAQAQRRWGLCKGSEIVPQD